MKLRIRHSQFRARRIVLAGLFLFISVLVPVYAQKVLAEQQLATPIQLSPDDNAVVNGKNMYTLRWTKVDGAVRYQYRSWHDSAAPRLRLFDATGTSGPSRVSMVATDATFWWQIRAVDANGFTSEWSSLRKITVDSTNPIINTSSAAQHPSSTTATITGSIIEQNLESISLKLDGTDVDSSAVTLTGNDFTAELQNLSLGEHTVEITATDKAGNKSAVRTHTFTVADNIIPTIAITSPTTLVEDEDVVVTGTATDNHSEVSEVSIHVDGAEKGTATVTNGEFSHNLAQLAPGTYEITAKGTDATGNEATSDPVTLTITTKPVVTPPVTPPIVVNPETPDPTPAEPAPSPQPQPAPTRTAYLQPAANTAQTTTDTPDDEEATVEVDALALNNSLSARTQDIRGTTDSKNPTPSLLGFAWYYWAIAVLSVAVITLWGLLVGRRRKEEEQ